ncbi:MAG TPA: CBS domain-containing protein, partial [Candidatus Eisenbacteria bacterium]|nr:CBS domain-containing protein [Candidatus Eisenbacteria bacterium]
MRLSRRRPQRVTSLMRSGATAVGPATCLADVARRMRDERVGAVAVMRGAELVGIVTERDLMRAVADGIDPRTAPASERMTPAPRTIGPDELAGRAAELMVELGVRHLPVVGDGEV